MRIVKQKAASSPLTLVQVMVNYYINNENLTILTLLDGDGYKIFTYPVLQKNLIEKRKVQWFSMATWRKDAKEDEGDGDSLTSKTSA